MGVLSASLLAWIEAVTGAAVVDIDELTGGASRSSFILTAKDGNRSFLRLDAGHGPLSGTAYTLEREYGALAQLQKSGLPIARVYGFSPEHQAMLMEFLPGHTTYEKIGTADEEAALRRELVAVVVKLQQVDPGIVSSLGVHLLEQVDPGIVSSLGVRSGAPLGEVIPLDLKEWRHL
jgi:aminoglycoside phosphotransferase (APT) family kinase protein